MQQNAKPELVRHRSKARQARIYRRGSQYYYAERRWDGSVTLMPAFPLFASPFAPDWSEGTADRAEPVQPRRSKRKAGKSAPVTRKERERATAALAPKPAAAKSGKRLSCEAAVGVVGEYGFSDVKPQSCSGKIYAFSATRDGAGYSIQMTSADGEISKVTKQLP
jgi:hypothetical protein